MNILHISDLHFGPRHWEGDDQILLEKINSYNADIVINTGDNTTDGLEDEYAEAGRFLKAITCEHVISTIGNHDDKELSVDQAIIASRARSITLSHRSSTG